MAATMCRRFKACWDRPAGAGGNEGAIGGTRGTFNEPPAVSTDVPLRDPFRSPSAKACASSSVCKEVIRYGQIERIKDLPH